MLAIGQKVTVIPINYNLGKSLYGRKREFPGRVVYINRQNRWLTVAYRVPQGKTIRESFSVFEIGRTVFERRKAK